MYLLRYSIWVTQCPTFILNRIQWLMQNLVIFLKFLPLLFKIELNMQLIFTLLCYEFLSLARSWIKKICFCYSYAIGGLAGGEDKDSFWRVVAQCTAALPEDKPRYVMVLLSTYLPFSLLTSFFFYYCVVFPVSVILDVMKPASTYFQGVGYPLDIVVCSALGADMYDCVYPTRTARFGTALVPEVMASW